MSGGEVVVQRAAANIVESVFDLKGSLPFLTFSRSVSVIGVLRSSKVFRCGFCRL